MALLAAAWCLPAAWIGLHGRFPLYDDWAYARTVEAWVRTGAFVRPAFVYAPTYSNALIGGVFVRLFGFSFEALRASTWIVGGLGVLASYGLCRQLRATPTVSALAAGALAANPLYFHLSYTFMTDVPFTLFVVGGLASFARGMERRSPLWLALAALAAVAAMLSRTPGVALPIAMGLAAVAGSLHRPRVWIPVVVLLVIASLVYWWGPTSLFGASKWLLRTEIGWFMRRALERKGLAVLLVRNGVAAVYLLGLSIAPVVLLHRNRLGATGWSLVGLAAATGLAAIAVLHLKPPYSINQIRDLGLGVINLSGREVLPTAPTGTWAVLAFLGIASAATAALAGGADLWRERARVQRSPGELAALIFPLVYLGPLGLQWPFFDRWLIPVIPLLLALLARHLSAAPERWRQLRATGAVALLAVFAVVGTRDQFTYQRALASLSRQVIAQGIPPAEIDGGNEFNAWYHFGRVAVAPSNPITGDRWVMENTVILSLAPRLPGYEPFASRSYRTLLPPSRVVVTAFRRR